jgi:hypothetical protein
MVLLIQDVLLRHNFAISTSIVVLSTLILVYYWEVLPTGLLQPQFKEPITLVCSPLTLPRVFGYELVGYDVTRNGLEPHFICAVLLVHIVSVADLLWLLVRWHDLLFP